MTHLTPEQEEKFYWTYLEEHSQEMAKRDLKEELFYFARLYHTEATKAGVSGEVKTAEEIMSRHFGCDMSTLTGQAVVAAILEYAAQFESRWRPIEEVYNYPNQKMFAANLEKDCWEYGTLTYIKRGTLDFIRHGFSTKPSHFMIPSPPNPTK